MFSHCERRRSGSAMRRFLDGEEAPQEYEVHLWEAAVAAPHQQVPLGRFQVRVRVRCQAGSKDAPICRAD